MIFLALVLDRQRPTRILRGETGEHRLTGMHGHVEWPRARWIGHLDGDAAEAAEANLGHAPSGFDAADRLHPAIDAAFAERAFAHLDAECCRIANECLDQRLDQPIDAWQSGILCVFVVPAHLASPVFLGRNPATICFLRSATSPFAWVFVSARPTPVHIGLFLSMASRRRGLSATQSGQLIPSGILSCSGA